MVAKLPKEDGPMEEEGYLKKAATYIGMLERSDK